MITSTSAIRVRYAETDMMGLTYHGNYFTWFEVGRVQMMDELGLPYRELEKRGYRLPVLEAHANFLRPTFFDDRLELRLAVRERPTARLRIDYELYRGAEQCLTGHTVHAFVNHQGEPVKPPADVLEKMRGFFRKA
ncbi:MAG TPA: thioesterase family protein [Opitutales bacterium]|nr:thioesterase family protein [Opitutales bacterium]